MAIKKQDYLYLSAALRAREVKMLTNDRAARMIDAGSFGEAAKILTDCGYEDMSQLDAKEIDKALADKRAGIFAELERIAPDRRVVNVFRMKYDYHNAKTAIKADAMGIDGARLMSESSRIPAEKLTSVIREERYAEVPGKLAAAIAEAKETLARTSNPQLADFILDRAYFAELSEAAKGLGSAFLTGYAKLLIDSANLKSAVRTMRMGKPADLVRSALVPDGGISEGRILSALSGDALAAVYSGTALEKAAALGAQAVSGGSMTEFELECDNAVTGYLTRAKRVSFGEEPAVAYLAAVEGEITAVRMILTGFLAGISPEVIRERMRELYA